VKENIREIVEAKLTRTKKRKEESVVSRISLIIIIFRVQNQVRKVHAKAYRSLTNLTVTQLRPFLKANPFLRPIYDQLRSGGNLLVEEQALLRGSLEELLEEED